MPRAAAGDRKVLTHCRRGEPSSHPTLKLLAGRAKGAALLRGHRRPQHRHARCGLAFLTFSGPNHFQGP